MVRVNLFVSGWGHVKFWKAVSKISAPFGLTVNSGTSQNVENSYNIKGSECFIFELPARGLDISCVSVGDW